MLATFTRSQRTLLPVLLSGLALCGAVVAGPLQAAQPSVPYVPTPQVVVDRMLAIAGVKAGDYLIDLGSGDGRIVITAAQKYGTRGFGVDLNPVRIREAEANAVKAGVTDKVAFYERDLFETDLSSASVITMYLLPNVNLSLRPKLLKLAPGTRLVSHDFSMDEWKPDQFEQFEVKDKWGSGSSGTSSIYFWVVPAEVAGTWKWTMPVGRAQQTYELGFTQRFQEITGIVHVNGKPNRVERAQLRGDRLTMAFTVDLGSGPVRHEFSGRVEGGTITGTARFSGDRVSGENDWRATRAGS
ncbi:MAG: SAM-dependent methyltransferase [Burkholderiales bacterium]